MYRKAKKIRGCRVSVRYYKSESSALIVENCRFVFKTFSVRTVLTPGDIRVTHLDRSKPSRSITVLVGPVVTSADHLVLRLQD